MKYELDNWEGTKEPISKINNKKRSNEAMMPNSIVFFIANDFYHLFLFYLEI
ncbi:hypothetical protein DAT561_1461 [Melissococcus plutonius]|uniref:Uncharacterized protein n=1 Tax=Melissococcus plutonius TaxID=33970 RepID=A0A2Z5Y448_9ENTE|nr:hypothetical protein DAT561_1461 [Melissococcus plutonius]